MIREERIRADIVDFSPPSSSENLPDSSIVIAHREPIPNIFSIAVERHTLPFSYSLQCIRDELFGILLRSIGIGSSRDRRVYTKSPTI